MGQFLQGAIRSEADRGQRFRSRDPAQQHVARHLQNDLRESIVEPQFIRARRIVNRKLAGAKHGFATVLCHATDAVVAESDQEEILVGSGDARAGTIDALLL
jgi:hypothetical protein